MQYEMLRFSFGRTDPSVVTVVSDSPVFPLSDPGSTLPSPRGRRPSRGLTVDRGVPGVSRTGEFRVAVAFFASWGDLVG